MYFFRIGTTLEGVASRPVSLMDRLNLLQTAQNSWQTKVGEKDVEQVKKSIKFVFFFSNCNVVLNYISEQLFLN